MEKSLVKPQKRSLFAFDLAPPWATALRKIVSKHFADEASATAFVRHIVQEAIGCFLTEEEMREQELIAAYAPKPAPYRLQFAMEFVEKLKKKAK